MKKILFKNFFFSIALFSYVYNYCSASNFCTIPLQCNDDIYPRMIDESILLCSIHLLRSNDCTQSSETPRMKSEQWSVTEKF